MLFKQSNFIAVASDDFIVRMYDLTTQKLVRRFKGHTHRITDMCFSHDGRWLLTSALDRSVRVWDLPTGRCIDWIEFEKSVVSLTLSPTDEYLATAHVGHIGLFLWANRSFFNKITVDGQLDKPYEIDLPEPLAYGTDSLNTAEGEATALAKASPEKAALLSKDEGSGDVDMDASVVVPKDSSITLSNAPRSHWQTLFRLELIKLRNKPIEAPTKPKDAPFFLATTHEDFSGPKFDLSSASEATDSEMKTRSVFDLPLFCFVLFC